MIPSCWEITSIGDLFEITHGKSVTPSARTGSNQVAFLRTSNVFWGKIDLTNLDRMDFTETEIKRMSLNNGDLLVCEGGDIGRTAVWTHGFQRCAFQNHLHRLRAKDNTSDPFFYMYWLQAGFTLNGFYDGVGNRTTIPNLSRSRLAALDVPRPPISEQRLIAAVLWRVQQAIDVESDLIRVSRELKAAVMKKLFTEGLNGEPQKETEIGLVPESWDIRNFGDIAKIFNGYAFKSSEVVPSSMTQLLRMGNLYQSQLDLARNPSFFPDSFAEEYQDFVLKPSDIVMSLTGTMGKEDYGFAVEIPRNLCCKLLLNQRVAKLIVKQPSKICERFFLHYLRTRMFLDRLYPTAKGTKQANLSSQIMLSLKFPVPSFEEQMEIATVLDAIDADLDNREEKVKRLNELFITALSELMSASIRVTDLNIDTTCLEPQVAA